MEAVKILEAAARDSPAYEGAERSEGDGGNFGAVSRLVNLGDNDLRLEY
jgi:hypothetical protein